MGKRLSAQEIEDLKAQLNQMVDEALAEGEEALTLTGIEDIALRARQTIGERLTAALIQEQVPTQVPGPACEDCGREMHYKGSKKRQVMTRSGEVTVSRAYYYCEQCRRGFFPPG